MAIFSIEIADQDVGRVIESLCINYRRPDKIKDEHGNEIDNPESKPMFANRMVREFLGDHVRKYELDLVKQTLENSINPPSINDPYI